MVGNVPLFQAVLLLSFKIIVSALNSKLIACLLASIGVEKGLKNSLIPPKKVMKLNITPPPLNVNIFECSVSFGCF